MLVANIIGYDFSFKYNGEKGKGVIKIPFDQKPYIIPDDIDLTQFKELKEVVVVDTSGKIKKEPTPVDEQNVEKKETEKPLKGVKIKKRKRKVSTKKKKVK